jgi:hypothetical protein
VDASGAERAADFLDGTLALDDHQFVRRKPDRVVDVARARHATLRPRPAHVLPKLTRVVAIDVAPDLFACHAMVIVCKDVPHVVEVIGNVFEARDSSSSQHALSRGRPLELIAEVASIRRRMHSVRRLMVIDADSSATMVQRVPGDSTESFVVTAMGSSIGRR